MRYSILRFLSIVLLSSSAFCQTASSPTTARATSVLQMSLASLVGNTFLQDLKLTGSAQWSTAPSDSSGPVTLEVLPNSVSRLEIGIASITEVRDSSSAIPTGRWKDADGNLHELATHNCWSSATWFLPYGFVAAALGSDAVVVYVRQENHNGLATDHVRYYRNVPAKSAALAALLRRLTAVDLFLDSTTHLPLSVNFKLHPDEDTTTDLDVVVQFSDYRVINGIRTPFRIQRYLDGGLQFDATIDNAVVNGGLPPSDFTLQ